MNRGANYLVETKWAYRRAQVDQETEVFIGFGHVEAYIDLRVNSSLS